MRQIKWASDIIRANLSEARTYILKAHELMPTDKPAAEWCKAMAVAHMGFNTQGHSLVASYISAYKGDSDLLPGMKAVYESVHADLVKEAAEIQGMISALK